MDQKLSMKKKKRLQLMRSKSTVKIKNTIQAIMKLNKRKDKLRDVFMKIKGIFKPLK